MAKKEQELGVAGWMERHFKQIGITVVTSAVLSAGIALYEFHQNRQKNVAAYLAKSDLFELDKDEDEPLNRTTLVMRGVAAASLTRPQGATPAELQRIIEPSARFTRIGPTVLTLLGRQILQEVDSKKGRAVMPHPAFVAALATDPQNWDKILARAQELDTSFDPAQLFLSVEQPPEIPNGSW